MRKSLLQLEDCWLTRFDLRTEATAVVPDDAPEALPRITWTIRKSSEDSSYLVTLRVSDNSPHLKLAFDMQGTFTFQGEAPDRIQARMIQVNAPSILYGVARGVVAGMSGFTPHRRYLLPSVNMVELAEKREKQQARAAKKKTVEPEP